LEGGGLDWTDGQGDGFMKLQVMKRLAAFVVEVMGR